MAASKISALTADTAPHRTNDFAPTYDASAVATKRVALKDFGQFEIAGGFSNSSPADATTYYFGASPSTTLQTTGGARRLYISRPGIITTVYLTIHNLGTAGSAETSTLSLRLNNSSDTTLFTTIGTSGSGLVFSGAVAITLSVTNGDYVEFKWVTPTWATNPTAVYMHGQITVA